MKAARIHNFGDAEVIRVEEASRPRPSSKQILVKVAASSLNHIDLSLRQGEMKALTRFQLPKTLGFDLTGEVVECGSAVTSFWTGDRVAAMTGLAAGAAAEYCCVDQDNAVRLPDGIDWVDGAATLLAGSTALQAQRGIAHLREGQRVLINGASGGVGGYGVQLAKRAGARVTAVCRESHFEHVVALGADATIDYQKQPLEEIGEKFDVIFDAAAKLGMEQAKSLAHNGGRVVTTRAEPRQVVESLVERFRGSFKMSFMMVKPRPNDMALLLRFLQAGELKPCVVRTFDLEQIAEAHRYLENESVAGKVVVRCSG